MPDRTIATGGSMTVRGGGNPSQGLVFTPVREWARRPGALLPKRICCFMVRVPWDRTEYKIAGQGRCPGSASSPRFTVDWPPTSSMSTSRGLTSGRSSIQSLTCKAPYKP